MDLSKYRLSAAELENKSSALDPPSPRKARAPVWNRLEGRPRGTSLARALRAEVRDPLWMLTRQWQMGELAAQDAGTPVFADLRYTCSSLRDGGGAPLEARIERQPVFRPDQPPAMNLRLRVQIGNYWLKLLATDAELAPLKDQFLRNPRYALSLGANAPGGAGGIRDAAQYLALHRDRTFDGHALLVDPRRFDAFAAQNTRLELLFGKLQAWYRRLILQPEAEADRWKPSQLEYSDAVTVVAKTADPQTFVEKKLAVREYAQGHLDWHAFEIEQSTNTAATAAAAATMKSREYHRNKAGVKRLLPSPVSFDGMPESRFWAFEDGGTNLASIRLTKDDLGKLALLEFALIYANDWSLLPVKVPVGSYVEIEYLSVTDSFGKATPIPAASQRDGARWDRWSFFTLDRIMTSGSNAKPDGGIFYPPSLARSLHGAPLEEVVFIRDETANLAWAIETVVPTPLGEGVSGRERASTELRASRGDKLVYEKRTRVPGNWIPFVPVQVGPRRLLRRGVLRDETSGRPIRPLTGILRPGLRNDDTWEHNYDIDDGEILRDGTIVTRRFQRTRWTNGEVYVWLALQRTTGKGQGSSGLAFDRTVPGDV